MKLNELFDIRNGIASTGISISPIPLDNSIPYLRPSSTQQRTIAGWILKTSIAKKNIYPEGSLIVSTNGEGSHSYSYVSQFEFACNSDVAVLIPKRTMTVKEKIFYARCITMNRYKFSYGRKPKGERLKQIDLPDKVPSWIFDIEIDGMWGGLERLQNLSSQLPPQMGKIQASNLVCIQDIFDVRYGHSLELNRLQLRSRKDGGIPFISRKMGDNGIAAYVAPVNGVDPAPAGELSCALSGNGVLSTFYQESSFYTGFHVACLKPKVSLNIEELLYYCSCIWHNRYRFSYGRQANRTLKNLLIPSPETIPFWVYGSLRRISNEIPPKPNE